MSHKGTTAGRRKQSARSRRGSSVRRSSASRPRAQRNRVVALIVGDRARAAVVIGALVLFGGNSGGPTRRRLDSTGSPLPDAAKLPGVMQTAPPWPNNTDQLAARLAAARPSRTERRRILHHHIRLFIYVDGQPVVVPANIGIGQTVSSPLHTHDTTGTVHVESADPNFQPVLGQFMDVWGLVLHHDVPRRSSATSGDRQLRVFVERPAVRRRSDADARSTTRRRS